MHAASTAPADVLTRGRVAVIAHVPEHLDETGGVAT
jgi:hypothetical protein